MVETQAVEYKDFSKSKELNKKTIISKLFKEITSFANSKGGKIIIGKEDKTGINNPQPKEILEWLENDLLTSEINRLSDNLVIFECEENEGIVTIIIQESDDVVSAIMDSKGVNKGDCYTRENHQAKIAKGNALKNLIERKTISLDSRLNNLRKIVHHKFASRNNSTSKLNIFDSLVISLESEEDYISTLFDKLIKHQFICGYILPFSKYTTIQMHIETVDALLMSKNNPKNNSILLNRDAFETLKKNSEYTNSLIKSYRDNALSSIQLKNYIIENRDNIEK